MDNKDKDFRKLSIDSFFNFEADGIDISLNQVKIIHNSGDIPSSGNQFEIAIRNFFKNKLPDKFYISNGHIIDSLLSTSPQIDLIISDNFRTPILYRTYDNTEYLTYESVYSYAEIKSSWNSKYLSSFIETRERIDKFLVREDIPPNFVHAGGKGIYLNVNTTENSCKNPLFSFMFVGNSNNFSYEDIKDLYENTEWKYLPNVLCLFDKGIVVNISKTQLEGNILKINLYPEFIVEKEDNQWVFLHLNKKRSTLGTMFFIILEHLNTCVLGSPNMLDYMKQIFEITPEDIDFLKDY